VWVVQEGVQFELEAAGVDPWDVVVWEVFLWGARCWWGLEVDRWVWRGVDLDLWEMARVGVLQSVMVQEAAAPWGRVRLWGMARAEGYRWEWVRSWVRLYWLGGWVLRWADRAVVLRSRWADLAMDRR
jgi:hypothetical protein